jgi:glycosyltransferase involved in cell wall biosynthesis
VILFLHHRYRTAGGEERAVEDLVWLVREHLGEAAELLERDSAVLGRRRAATALLAGGLRPEDVGAAVRRTGARIVHAHNLLPSLGWRSLAAARAAGARVVLHLHNYRLVCAVSTCFTHGEDCTRCHGRNTVPGLRLNCRGSAAEAAAYAAGLAVWQRRLIAQADAVVVPSASALERLDALGVTFGPAPVHVVPGIVRDFAPSSRAGEGRYAVVVSRLAPEKGVDVAAAACARAGLELRVAGDGPERDRLAAAAPDARFLGRLDRPALAELLDGAGAALVPTRAAETFGLAAAEAMAAGVPVVGSRIGALPDLIPDEDLVPPGDAATLAAGVERRWRDAAAGEAGIARARSAAAPEVAARALAAVYARLRATRSIRSA